VLNDFVAIGGRAVLTCVETEKLDISWLGRVIDGDFVRDIGGTGSDPCGENGEYHSFAFAGPFFPRPLAWHAGERRDDGRFAQLDLNTDLIAPR
ncbi:MAG: ATP-binding protein, partial [Chloroflexota bacterium]